MKKVFLIVIIGVALTMIGCSDGSKKKLWGTLLAGAAVTETVTDPGTGVTPAPTDPSTGDTAATTGMGDSTSATTTTPADTSSATSSTGTGTETGTATTPTDVNNDTNSDTGFQYQTIISVMFNLTIQNASLQPVSSAAIKVNAGTTEASASVTNADGFAAFKATLNKTDTSVTLVIEHPDYITKTITIDNIQDLATVTRTIYLEKKVVEQPPAIVDTDGDGVADDLDQYPNDPNLIATVYNEYTIAYEDGYPSKGDADFNDLVVKIGITEFINPQNKISKINIRSKVLASGAGYTNQFWIGILGTSYKLIANPKTDLKSGTTQYSNCLTTEKNFYSAPVHSLDIVFTTPVDRTAIAPMPYDPYIICNGVAGKESHLPFVATTFTGTRLDSDKFPWALLIPSTWQCPYEDVTYPSEYQSMKIGKAYANFVPWYKAEGKSNADWYLYPTSGYVYTLATEAGSALTTYLLKISGGTRGGIIGSLLATVVVSIVGINIWRRKKHTDLAARK